MTPAIEEHDVTVLLGDTVEQMRTLDAGSAQCVVTSPPYYGLRDYGHPGQIGLEPSPAEYVARMVGVFAEAKRVLADDGVLWLNIGDSYSSTTKGSGGTGKSGLLRDGRPEEQRLRLSDLANTRAKFAARTFHADVPAKNMLGIPWRLAFALQDDGWTLRNDVIWAKPNAMPESVTDRLSTRYEHVFLLTKSKRYRFNLDAIKDGSRAVDPEHAQRYAKTYAAFDQRARETGVPGSPNNGGIHSRPGDGRVNPGDVWTIPTAPFPGAHFACMPPELARRCILAGSTEGDTVLDPFAGSGTTLKVARSLNRKSVGVELNPDYLPIIRERIGDVPFDFGAAVGGES